jgi:hypothetical protein
VKDSLARRLAIAGLSLALFLVLAEGVLSWLNAAIQARERSQRPPPEQAHARHDAELGWTSIPGKVVRDLYGPGRDFSVNAQGIRATERYSAAVPAGRCRSVFAGDSFTMGFGVGDADTYPAQLERLDPRLQSVNLGMGAYGADQAFLRYRRDAAEISHDVAVLAFIAHDFRRMEVDFYMAPKPQLAREGDRLVVRNVPVPERDAGEDARAALTAFLQNLDLAKALARVASAIVPAPTPQAAEGASAAQIPIAPVAEAMFEEMARLARERGARPLLVYLPTRADLAGQPQRVRDWAKGAAEARGIQFVDATPALAGRALPPLFGLDNHYSEVGNALVAEALLPTLRALCGFAAAAPTPATPEPTLAP